MEGLLADERDPHPQGSGQRWQEPNSLCLGKTQILQPLTQQAGMGTTVPWACAGCWTV